MRFKKGWSDGRSLEEIYGKEKSLLIKEKKAKAMSEGRYKNLFDAAKKQGVMRKGKSIEELYGKEKADEIKEKIRKAREMQSCPRAGKTHSIEAKNKMSSTRLKLLEENPEMIVEQSKRVKKWWADLTMEERGVLRENRIDSLLSYKRYKAHSVVTKIKNWWTGEDVICESSYEYYCFFQFNLQKVFWKKNTSLKIPYIQPMDYETHWYLPDFLVYAGDLIVEVGEVKPYEFAYNPKNKTSDYYLITKAKLDALKAECEKMGWKYRVVTELDLDLNIIKNNPIINEDKKDYQKDLLTRKKRILC